MPAATSSAVWKPLMNASGVRSPPAFPATIAPMIATPIVPPTCRAQFSTADPTPALSTGTLRVAAAALGVMVSDMPTPPITSAGRRSKKDASTPSREKMRSWTERRIIPAVMRPLDPSRSLVFPASGAMKMISMVIGRKAAPACTAE